MYKVIFLPDMKEVEVEAGTTLLEAAEKAGVYINSLCGGEGVCGRCRVQIINGGVKADKNSISFLTKEEIKEGYVLACQTKVEDSLEVVIPPEYRLEGEQILLEGSAVHYSLPERISVAKISSLWQNRKFFFGLQAMVKLRNDNTVDFFTYVDSCQPTFA